MNPPIKRNQLHAALLGSCALNPFHKHTSSSRAQMYASHLGQMLQINGATQRYIQTGMEREYGKYTFNVKMPEDGLILHIIPRYTKTLGKDSIEETPQYVVIYEESATQRIGMINLVSYSSNHQYFGFRYKEGDGYKELREGNYIPKGTIFLDSPAVQADGGYAFGLQANVVFMSHPATSEDGILISDEIVPKLGFRTYETRVIEWGKKKFALNLYGNDTEYKTYPDIGDVIRPDGVLMALRSYDPSELSIVEQGIKDTQEIDFKFDTTFYANGAGGRVVDIKIHHDINNRNCAEVHMDKQSQKYDNARRQFYKKIMEVYHRWYAKRKDALQITPELHRMIVEAYSVDSEGPKQNISKLYRKAPLDEYRVEIVIEYEIKPGIGFKITDCAGGKGVIVQVARAQDMPVDAEGNRADIIFDPNSTISRMNLGRLYEQYLNASSRDTLKIICNALGVLPNTNSDEAFQVISRLPEAALEKPWNYLYNFYGIVSPEQQEWISPDKNIDKVKFLSEIVSYPVIGIHYPPDNEPDSEQMIMALEKDYRPCYGPVTYTGNSGRTVTTKDNVRVGSLYVILLEKIGDDWSSVSSGKLQHFGVLSQLTKTDKYSRPARNQAVRGIGEAELRILVSYISPEFVAEIMDRNNSPKTHKHVVSNILKADKPGNIENLVDRQAIPFGSSKPLNLIHHMSQCSGFSFEYEPYRPTLSQNSHIPLTSN